MRKAPDDRFWTVKAGDIEAHLTHPQLRTAERARAAICKRTQPDQSDANFCEAYRAVQITFYELEPTSYPSLQGHACNYKKRRASTFDNDSLVDPEQFVMLEISGGA